MRESCVRRDQCEQSWPVWQWRPAHNLRLSAESEVALSGLQEAVADVLTLSAVTVVFDTAPGQRNH